MGAGWFLAREEGDAVQLPHGGRAVLFAQFQLEEFARENGLTPLKEFFASDPEKLRAYFRDQGLDPSEYDLPDEEWYDPSEMLLTLRATLAGLPDDIPGREKVRADLAAMLQAVETADAAGDRVHIATAMPDLRDRPEPG